MSIPRVPVSFPDFVKFPLQTVVYLLLAYFIYKEFTKKDDCADLRNITVAQDIRITKLESDKSELVTAILIKNGIIDKFVVTTDSLAREKVGKQSKQIINKNK